MQTGLGTQEKQCRSRLCRYVLSASDGVQVYYAGESFFGMTGFLREHLETVCGGSLQKAWDQLYRAGRGVLGGGRL